VRGSVTLDAGSIESIDVTSAATAIFNS